MHCLLKRWRKKKKTTLFLLQDSIKKWWTIEINNSSKGSRYDGRLPSWKGWSGSHCGGFKGSGRNNKGQISCFLHYGSTVPTIFCDSLFRDARYFNGPPSPHRSSGDSSIAFRIIGFALAASPERSYSWCWFSLHRGAATTSPLSSLCRSLNGSEPTR